MAPEHTHPHRKDRSRDEAWIRALLHRAGAGVLVTVRGDKPFPIPLNYVYDEDQEVIYFHTGKRGATLENMDGRGEEGTDGNDGNDGNCGAVVALSVFEMGRLLPAAEAGEFGVEYKSVVVFGRGSVVEDPKEVEAALVLIMEKYAPHLKAGEDYRPVAPEEVKRTAIIRVDIESWSGKEKKEAPDFPGAYLWEDVRRV